MDRIYLICAVIGGTIFLLQLLLSLLGFGSHELGMDHVDIGHDCGHDHGGAGHEHGPGGGSSLGGYVTFRSMIAAITFFGLCGMVANSNKLDSSITIVCALVGGFAAMMLVGVLMQGLSKLKDEGTAHIEQAIGKPATVYLTIPAKHTGQGKVTVIVQNRTMEYLAVTAHDALPTGSKVLVVDIVSGDTVEVEPEEA